MKILSEQKQIDAIRHKCDKAKRRIWIASPFIGSLKDVQKILGGRWMRPSIECRVLTDIENGFIRQDTFKAFVDSQIEVKSLESIHAKIYVIDDWCLVTSANLTGTAFFCRYEMGIATEDISEIVDTFERWWKMADPVGYHVQNVKKAIIEYQDGQHFKQKFKAPSYSYDSQRMDKYGILCDKYNQFSQIYEQITGRNKQMRQDGYTLFQEVDYFFNYLLHDHPNTPSKGQNKERQLTAKQRDREILFYFKQMSNHYVQNRQLWRVQQAKRIHELLSKDSINNLDWGKVSEVINYLHCQSSYPPNKVKFLNPQNNNLRDIIYYWSLLLHSGKINDDKIREAKDNLYSFGYSSIFELIGWFYPNKFPLMNSTSDCGMRFFGYHI